MKTTTLDDIFGDYETERLAELKRQDEFDKTSEGQAILAEQAAKRESERQARVRLGWETEDGEAIPQPGDDEEEDDEDDPHASCDGCGDEHPVGVLEDGLCPSCVDEED
jgi:hypothetical protein